jgi:hypothetical protein
VSIEFPFGMINFMKMDSGDRKVLNGTEINILNG